MKRSIAKSHTLGIGHWRAGLAIPLILAVHAFHGDAQAVGVDPADASAVEREQAQTRFGRGKKHFAKKEYEGALKEFRASLDIVASPNTRLLIGHSLRELGRLVEAYAEFGAAVMEAKALQEGDKRYARAAEAAQKERDKLKARLGFVNVAIESATDETTLTIAGEKIRRPGWVEPVPVMPGEVEVVVETPGFKPSTKTVTLAAGENAAVSLDAQAEPIQTEKPAEKPVAPPPPPPKEEPSRGHENLRPFAYVAGGVGVAGLLTFAIAGSMARSTYNELDSDCAGGPCPPEKADTISSGRTKQTIANVGLGVGLVGLAAGATLFVLSMPSSEPDSPSAGLVVSPGWVGIRGRM